VGDKGEAIGADPCNKQNYGFASAKLSKIRISSDLIFSLFAFLLYQDKRNEMPRE
jgi:hypothetical protein